MTMPPGTLVLTVLLGILCLHCVDGQYPSLCQSVAYRSLSTQLQNEHQCRIIEQLQDDIKKEGENQAEQYDSLFRMMTILQDSMKRGFLSVARSNRREHARSTPALGDIPIVRDCQELYQSGVTVSGVYPIRLPTKRLVNVQCDMETSNGGWTVIQRRLDGSVNFTRLWNEYAFGFGNVNTEYWLGNEHIYRMTSILKYSIRIDLWDWDDNHAYALYDDFRVDNEYTLYQLHIEHYSGTAGDSMGEGHNKMRFSTIDSDNDQWHSSCAKKDQSGWWFQSCGYSSLNGLYMENGKPEISPDGLLKGIIWYYWKNDSRYSLKRTEMKIKPLTSILYEREQEQLKQVLTTVPTTVQPTTAASKIIQERKDKSEIEPDIEEKEIEFENNPAEDAIQGRTVKANKEIKLFEILEKNDQMDDTITAPFPSTTEMATTTQQPMTEVP